MQHSDVPYRNEWLQAFDSGVQSEHVLFALRAPGIQELNDSEFP